METGPREFAIFYLENRLGKNYCLYKIKEGKRDKGIKSIIRLSSVGELGNLVKKIFRELPTDRSAQVYLHNGVSKIGHPNIRLMFSGLAYSRPLSTNEMEELRGHLKNFLDF